MTKHNEYCVIINPSRIGLSKAVMELMNQGWYCQGWYCQGGVAVDPSHCYSQALVR